MDRALRAATPDGLRVTILRPGMIYGPGSAAREWTLVKLIKEGTRELRLPLGGGQFFSRVALERVGRAVVAAAERAPEGTWVANVVDPYGWTYAGLAAEIAELLGWRWEPAWVDWHEASHLFKAQAPFVCSDTRLRDVLGVTGPDPRAALAEAVRWLWDHGQQAYPDA